MAERVRRKTSATRDKRAGVLNGKDHCGLQIGLGHEFSSLPKLLQECCRNRDDLGTLHRDLANLIRDGSDVKERCTETGTTALMVAAANGCAQAVELLIKEAADEEFDYDRSHSFRSDNDRTHYVNACDQDECTALMMAAKWGQYRCVRLLLEAQADPVKMDCAGWTALLYAAKNSHVGCTQLLLKAGSKDIANGSKVIANGTFSILIEHEMDSVLDFLVEQLIEVNLLVRAFAEDPSKLQRVAMLIDRPGASGKRLLEALFKEEYCPVRYKDRYLPASAPLTHLSDEKEMNLNTSMIRDGHGHGHGQAGWKGIEGCSLSVSERRIAAQENERVEDDMRDLLRDGLELNCRLQSLFQIFCRVCKLEQTQKSQVALFSCPVRGIVSREIIAALASAPSDEPLKTELARAIIEHAWSSKFAYIHILDFLFGIVHLSMLCIVSREVRAGLECSWAALAVLVVIEAKRSMELTCELRMVMQGDPRQKKCSLENILGHLSIGIFADLAHLVLDWVAILHLYAWRGTVTERRILGFMIVGQWARTLWRLRAFDTFGRQIIPIVFAMKDTCAFFIVAAFGLCAGAHFYYVTGTHDAPSTFYAAVVVMYRLMMLGDFDLFELEDVDPILVPGKEGSYEPKDPDPTENYVTLHLLFYGVSLLFTIVLLNLLISILGSNYERHDDNSIPLFLRARAQIITAIGCRPWFLDFKGIESQWERKYLWTARKAAFAKSDLRTTRAIIGYELEPLSKSLGEQDATLKDQLNKQQIRLEGVEDILQKLLAEVQQRLPLPGDLKADNRRSAL